MAALVATRILTMCATYLTCYSVSLVQRCQPEKQLALVIEQWSMMAYRPGRLCGNVTIRRSIDFVEGKLKTDSPMSRLTPSLETTDF